MPRRLSNPLELLEVATSKLRRQDSSDDEHYIHNHASTGNLRGGSRRTPRTNRETRRSSSYLGPSSSNSSFGLVNDDDLQLSDSQNIFPTRNKDLRHVDQSVNLMDAETANYKAPRSDYVFARQNSSGNETSDDEDSNPKSFVRRGSFAMIQDGLVALRHGAVPRRGSLTMVDLMRTEYDSDDEDDVELSALPGKKAPKHHSMSFLTDLEDCSERLKSLGVLKQHLGSTESSSSSSDHSWADHLIALRNAKMWRNIFWTFVLSILVVITTLTILYWDAPPHGQQDLMVPAEVAVTAPPTPLLPTDVDEHVGTSISTAPGSIARRRLVLEHVIEKGLLPEIDHDSELDLRTPSSRKAVQWMTGKDETSMKILDDYHYYHHDHDKEEPIVLGKHYTIAPVEIKQERQILDRYIHVVFYFVAHPDANVKTAEIH